MILLIASSNKPIGFCCQILTILLIALTTSCYESQPTSDSSPKPNPNQSPDTLVESSDSSFSPSTYGIGEVIAIKRENLDVQFTVNEMREHQGKGVIKPNQGQKWILVDITLANQGAKPKTFSIVSFELKDSKNQQYEIALLAGALDDVNNPTGEINPGEKLQGEVVFEVPEMAQGLKLVFHPNFSDCSMSTTEPKSSAKADCEPIVVQLN
ncbi:MAG: DUF4352 domain-containing protein [Symploca sp. SIO2G7]|nr:DUF4352 domain-containing protein [Symploca sp. SIO2G7]